jgi:DNA-binding PadR family transcriptional regulator
MSERKRLKAPWFYILLALSDGDQHGADIVRTVLALTNGDLQLWPVTLYATLESLTDSGFITELPDAPSGQSERRRYYKLTASGRRALRREADHLERTARLVRSLLSRGAGDSSV